MEYVYVGKITSTHGIKGELKIKSYFKYKDLVFKKNNFCHIRRVYNSPANFRYFNRIGINSILFLLTQSLVPN